MRQHVAAPCARPLCPRSPCTHEDVGTAGHRGVPCTAWWALLRTSCVRSWLVREGLMAPASLPGGDGRAALGLAGENLLLLISPPRLCMHLRGSTTSPCGWGCCCPCDGDPMGLGWLGLAGQTRCPPAAVILGPHCGIGAVLRLLGGDCGSGTVFFFIIILKCFLNFVLKPGTNHLVQGLIT